MGKKKKTDTEVDKLKKLLDPAPPEEESSAFTPEQQERWDYSHTHPGFEGELLFDLELKLLGKTVTRKAKVVFKHTPEWPYYDLNKKAVHDGWESTQSHLEIEAVPENWTDDGTENGTWIPETHKWVQTGDLVTEGILPMEVWDGIYDAIDEQCKREDADRRKAAGIS